MCRTDFQTSVVMHTGAGAHLDRLLMPESLVELPWYQRLGAGIGSLAVHAAMIALLLFLGSLKPVQKAVKEMVTLIAPPVPVKVAENKGGGGGGARQREVKKAELPKPTPRQFVPPRTDPAQTKLEAPASLMADLPDIAPTAVGNLDRIECAERLWVRRRNRNRIGRRHRSWQRTRCGSWKRRRSRRRRVSTRRRRHQSCGDLQAGTAIFRRSSQSQVARRGAVVASGG